MCAQASVAKDPNSKDDFGRTRLHYSVRLGHYSDSRALLRSGADVNVIDTFGNTPLSLACVDKPNLAMVKLLLAYNADVNLERPCSIDLLLECVLNCTTPEQLNIIKLLIEHGKNINLTDKLLGNRSCMHLVAMTGYSPLAEVLIKMGAIVNIKDNFDNTPMLLARTHENYEVLRSLRTYLNSSRLI